MLAWLGLAVLGYLVYLVIRPFLFALGWASVLAVVFYPMHERLEQRWSPGWAALATTLAAAIVVVVPSLLVTVAFVREAIDAVNDLRRAFAQGQLAWLTNASASLMDGLPAVGRLDIAGMATAAAERGVTFLVSRTGFVLQNLATSLLTLVLALFATFFLLRDSDAIVDTIRRLMPLEPVRRDQLISRTRDLISAGVTSAGIVAAVQGLLGGMVFAILGIDAPVFWGVVMAVLCLLPFGAWVVWLPAAIVLMANGSVVRGLVLAGLGLGIISGADNVLRPLLLSGRARMNGLVILLGLLGGLSVFGLLGIVLGPVLVATALALVTSYSDSRQREPHPRARP